MADISRIDPLIWYREAVLYGMDYWVVPGLRRQREEVEQAQLNAEQLAKLWQLDRRLVNAVTDLDDPEVPDELLADDFTQPLSHWWWHLGKLRAGTYPAELLPESLRELYRPQATPGRVTDTALPL
jgi:hypothetical protein